MSTSRPRVLVPRPVGRAETLLEELRAAGFAIAAAKREARMRPVATMVSVGGSATRWEQVRCGGGWGLSLCRTLG